MKKMLFILLFSPVFFFGQDKSFELGLLFGGSINSFNGDTEFTKNTLQPAGGFLVQYNFNNRFSLKSKLLYHIKGAKTPIVFTDQSGSVLAKYDDRYDLHYLTFPLLAQFNFGKNKWRFFCNSGVYLGHLLQAEYVYDPDFKVGGETVSSISAKEYFNNLDFGLIIGSGLSFQMRERIKIFLESSFDHGLTNISALESNDVVLTQAITGSLGITYNFPIKKKTFNGTSTLKCADYNDNESIEVDEKKRSKWRLVLYKDGKKVGKKSKRGKSRLFKKKD